MSNTRMRANYEQIDQYGIITQNSLFSAVAVTLLNTRAYYTYPQRNGQAEWAWALVAGLATKMVDMKINTFMNQVF